MFHILICLFFTFAINLGMDCNDGIHAHFKVVNNDFIDVCNRVNIRPINGIISDNIINDTILRIENPFYLEFDHIPIYPVSMKPLHMGIHIQGYSKTQQKEHNNTYNETYNYYYSQNCVLGASTHTTECFGINSYDLNILKYRNTYYPTTSGDVSTFVNWTLYYSNEYETMNYFKDNLYVTTSGSIVDLNFFDIIGGIYETGSSQMYDIIFIENIIISITNDADFYGFQEYILGHNMPTIYTEKTGNPTVKPTIQQDNPIIQQNHQHYHPNMVNYFII